MSHISVQGNPFTSGETSALIVLAGQGGGSPMTFASETAIESPNGVLLTFTFAHSVGIIVLNQLLQPPGGVNVTNSGVTTTFVTAPFAGDDVRNFYIV